jgi:protein TonB
VAIRFIETSAALAATSVLERSTSIATADVIKPEGDLPATREGRPPAGARTAKPAPLSAPTESPLISGSAQPVAPFAAASTESSAERSGHVLADAPDYLPAKLLTVGPRPLEDIEPKYPDGADLRTGKVVLRLLIGDTGHVDDVAVVRATPPGLFDASAIEAFSKARFSPSLAGGIAVKSQMTVEVEFVPLNRLSRISGRSY